MDDEKWSVREQVAKALGNIGDKSATIPLLRRLHNDQGVYVRIAIVRALGEIGDKTSVPSLVEIAIKSAFKRQKDISEFIIRVLKKIDGQEVAEGLVRIVKENYLDVELRKEALAAIAELKLSNLNLNLEYLDQFAGETYGSEIQDTASKLREALVNADS